MDDKSQHIIDSLDALMLPATEDYSDVSLFFKIDDQYLESHHKQNPEETYTEPLGIDGVVYKSIIKACKELISVNAYTEALRIYQTFIDKLEKVSEGLNKRDKTNVESTIDIMQGLVLETMKLRDDYQSKRRSILAKYAGITKEL